MSEVVSTFPMIALVGSPNCGKTSLFNALTGGRQKVGNYPGVTVERKEAQITAKSGQVLSLLDLPGTYSLDARTPDEVITREVILGHYSEEASPEVLIAVADATNLERNLGLILEIRATGKPVVLALNMMDLAQKRGLELDLDILSRELGICIVPTVAVKGEGMTELLLQVEKALKAPSQPSSMAWSKPSPNEIQDRFLEIDRILSAAVKKHARPEVWTQRIDRIVLHPVWGSLLLFGILALMFQAIFTWSTVPQDWIKAGVNLLAQGLGGLLAEGPLKGLLLDGVLAGVGSVIVFLPQILLLFLFILILEDSGYMARAAFLMDRLMSRVGLHGRAFIPLLSSHACAIPGIMATRTIENRRDRLTTILVAPLTTCSARLPVYTLLIAAFIPNREIFGPFRLPGVVMLSLYLAGIVSALVMAFIFKLLLFRGPKPPFLMELPTYKWPSVKGVFLGLVERSMLFVRRAGSVILGVSILLWFLASYPKPPLGASEPAIIYSFAGRIGHFIEPLMRPIGFNWKIAVALIPGFAAREVMIGALATVYAVSETQGGNLVETLGSQLVKDWSLPTALSLLVWYILSCQCASTLAVTRRETNSWRWPIVMMLYMTTLAYLGSYLTFHVARGLGL